MSALKTLRRPYLAGFLTSLILLLSCSRENGNLESIENKQQLSLKEFVDNHISVTYKIYDLVKAEKNIDISILESKYDNLDNFNQLNQVFKNANIEKYNELSALIVEVYTNANTFFESNPEFSLKSREEKISELTDEVNYQLNYLSNSYQLKASGDCEDQKEKGEKRCQRNYAIGMAAATVGCISTVGAACVVSVLAVQTVAIVCNDDVMSDYQACKDQQK